MSNSLSPVRRQVTADTALRELLTRVISSGATRTSGPASHNAGRPIRLGLDSIRGAAFLFRGPNRLTP